MILVNYLTKVLFFSLFLLSFQRKTVYLQKIYD